MPWWVYLSIVLGCLGVIAVLVFFIVQLCKDDEDEEIVARSRRNTDVNPLASPSKPSKSEYVTPVGSILPTTEEDDVVLIRETPPQEDVVAEPSVIPRRSRRTTRNSTFLSGVDAEEGNETEDAALNELADSAASPRRRRRSVSFLENNDGGMDF
ncbi:hypothetical protein, conserved [Angomonas deanei]|uniref:Uncharacterized protein n=1 Tax=Angomonas deanei TaxID=59799 RepID=A0A7G2C2B4_9TRYP|nr:hypothetical protein, conserved [Angomonas deanei]